eukprot:3641932-Alexandrium_andersonii.AAC.1
MACNLIKLAVMGEAAAIDKSRPLEQIADSSGIARGGKCLRMSKDLGKFNVLLAAREGLTPARQAWPPRRAGRPCSAGDEAIPEPRARQRAFGLLG